MQANHTNTNGCFKYERMTAENTAVLLIEYQSALLCGVADHTQVEFRNNLSGLIGLIKIFNLPVILTTINEDINGPVIPELSEAFPKAPVIRREGEINVFDNKEIVAALKETNRKKLLIAGISTDACATYASLSAKAAGYDVSTLIDVCGTWSPLIQQLTIQRLSAAGVTPLNWFAVAGELQNDWRNPTAEALFGHLAKHLPFYGDLLNLAKAKGLDKKAF